jgi:type IV pilus assembly protein PilV
MIEVLIALVVLSIGLLGLASLQSRGLRSNQGASMRTQATQLAYDMSDRMRANMAATNAGNYISSSNANLGAVANCHNVAGCAANEMAADDLATWNQAVTRILPAGQWVICRDATPNDGTGPGAAACDNAAASPITVKLWWDDDRDGNVDQTPLSVAFEP